MKKRQKEYCNEHTGTPASIYIYIYMSIQNGTKLQYNASPHPAGVETIAVLFAFQTLAVFTLEDYLVVWST